jgi:hypothetical protein
MEKTDEREALWSDVEKWQKQTEHLRTALLDQAAALSGVMRELAEKNEDCRLEKLSTTKLTRELGLADSRIADLTKELAASKSAPAPLTGTWTNESKLPPSVTEPMRALVVAESPGGGTIEFVACWMPKLGQWCHIEMHGKLNPDVVRDVGSKVIAYYPVPERWVAP